MAFASVLATFGSVGTSYEQCVNHVLDEESGRLEVSQLDRRSTGWTAVRAIIFGLLILRVCECSGDALAAKGMRAAVRHIRVEEGTEADWAVKEGADLVVRLNVVVGVSRVPVESGSAAAEVARVGSHAYRGRGTRST